MRRRLPLPMVVVVVGALLAACGGDDDQATTPPPEPVTANVLSPTTVTVLDPGRAPRSVLAQDVREGASWDGGLQFDLAIEGVSSAQIVGDATITVDDIDDEGGAAVSYDLLGLDLAIGTGTAAPGTNDPDALDISGAFTLQPSRTAVSSSAEVRSDGVIEGVDAIAGSLDPRLAFLLIPFPDEPVGVGATWEVVGPLPLFGAELDLRAEVQLLQRRQGRYVLSLALGLRSPEDSVGVQLDLRGLGRVVGDTHQVGPRTGAVALSGTAVLIDRGPERLPATLRLELDQRAVGRGVGSS